jgi:drug/metabolite transporter (DMT)-like permease
MLQRSQTLYLLAVFLLALLMLTGPLARFSSEGGELVMKHSGLYNSRQEKLDLETWPLTLFFVVVSALAFFNIFSYRNRTRQMRVSIFLILMNAGMIGLMFYYTWIVSQKFGTTHTLHQWRFVIPLVCMVLIYLAFRRIRRDELLVKAYDRIR